MEHVFDRIKNYKTLRDCRQCGDGLFSPRVAVALRDDRESKNESYVCQPHM